MALKSTVFMSGKLFWAKVIGAPRMNYDGTGKEWAFEFEPDKAGVDILKQHKLTDRLKNKHEDRPAYLNLRKTELNKEGEPNLPIRIYDNDGEWDKTKLIGNGSKADVKLDIRDYGIGKKKGVYPIAIRVTELVEYKSSEFGAMDKPDGFKTEAKPKKVDTGKDFEPDLNDDVPF